MRTHMIALTVFDRRASFFSFEIRVYHKADALLFLQVQKRLQKDFYGAFP